MRSANLKLTHQLTDNMAMKRCFTRLAVVIGVVMMCHDAAAVRADGPYAKANTPVRHLSSLHRLVRHFDFEEAAQTPLDMPRNFYRFGEEHGATAQGFPPFGTMQLSDEFAYSGDWSFQFELDGGSLSARVPTAVIPVVPHADYAVAVRVRSEGLVHARARLVAWLHDPKGEIIEASRVVSDLIKTDGKWETHSVELRGIWDRAADLVIELQVLQPRQFLGSRGMDPDTPLLEDVGGRVWFDDVTVWHMPRVEMTTSGTGNVITKAAGDEPTLSILVRDLAHDSLNTRLRIFDIDGNTVHDEHTPAPRTVRHIELHTLPYGWYRAVLELRDGDELITRHWLDFTLQAPQRRGGIRPDKRFGIVLPDDWYEQSGTFEQLLELLRVGAIVLPYWTEDAASREAAAVNREKHRMVVSRLLATRARLTMSLHTVPQILREVHDMTGEEVLRALTLDSRGDEAWRDELQLLFNLGSEMHRWQVRATPSVVPSLTRLQQELDDAVATLGRYVATPTIAIELDSSQQIDRRLRVHGRSINVPQSMRYDAIGQYVEQWDTHDSPYDLHLELAPVERAGPYNERERAVDALLRLAHVLRADRGTVYIPAPWRTDHIDRTMPDPVFAVWSQFVERIGHRRFVGEVDLGDAIRCWMFRGDETGDDVLIAWTDRFEPTELVMQLADHDVTVIDMFGNAHSVPLVGGTLGNHRITVTQRPVYIEDISLPLVEFRGGYAVDPPMILSEYRTHEHEIVLRNPWPIPISGSIHLHEKDQWRLTPRSQRFSIAANDETRLPLEIVFDRSVLAGSTTIDATINIEADATYRLTMSAPVEVGLPHLELAATWRIVENAETGREDVVITQYITNTAPAGSEPVHADAYVMAADIRQDRRLVANLEPGQMAIRMFHIPDGATVLAGRTVRVTVADRHGPGRLNREIYIPSSTAEQDTLGRAEP